MKRLLAFDATFSQYLTLSPESGWWQRARVLAHLGDGPYIFGVLGLGYLLGWLWPNPFLRQAMLTVALSVLLTMGIVTLIKYLVRRERPHPPGEFVVFPYDRYSFPSGHSARMVALAVSTLFFYPLFGWALVVITLGVAVSRIVVGIHYFSDIVVGIGVGTLVAWGALPLLLQIIV